MSLLALQSPEFIEGSFVEVSNPQVFIRRSLLACGEADYPIAHCLSFLRRQESILLYVLFSQLNNLVFRFTLWLCVFSFTLFALLQPVNRHSDFGLTEVHHAIPLTYPLSAKRYPLV